ncbi:hypothetical protein PRIPAC_98078 [Pristionchus pacificus]|uniref:Uncharacterized protein n=1 Tax=Pristionchus pacificus TaxID=54126 RepID=A0A2A6D2P1_PRIPA|nr:hypothetical protein PRIPAC_98078 [Pristionchus pacificus]|eukprot:PDM84742.1 hypothetical protein PRIPAC_33765 [Pristionchus pacificus]
MAGHTCNILAPHYDIPTTNFTVLPTNITTTDYISNAHHHDYSNPRYDHSYSNSSAATTTKAPNTPTTVASTDCCPRLRQTWTSSESADGDMTFTYDNEACRSSISVLCSGDPDFNLEAAIVANGMNFLEVRRNNVTFPGTCIGGTWFMSSPPLAIATIECQLANPTSP